MKTKETARDRDTNTDDGSSIGTAIIADQPLLTGGTPASIPQIPKLVRAFHLEINDGYGDIWIPLVKTSTPEAVCEVLRHLLNLSIDGPRNYRLRVLEENAPTPMVGPAR